MARKAQPSRGYFIARLLVHSLFAAAFFGPAEISAEDRAMILRDYGTIVTVEEARIILEFMWKLANLTLDQYLSL